MQIDIGVRFGFAFWFWAHFWLGSVAIYQFTNILLTKRLIQHSVTTMLGLLFDFITSPSLLRHHLVLVVVVLGCSLQVNATSYAQFPADGYLLKTAVKQYCGSSDPSTFEFTFNNVDYGPIEDWRTGLVTNMRGLFDWVNFGFSCTSPNISAWDTSAVTNMDGFATSSYFNSDISAWNTSSVVTMEFMFTQASKFKSDISAWDTAKVTNMRMMFYQAGSFNSDLSNWDTSSVTSMYQMFMLASSFNQDLCSWKSDFPYSSSYNIFYGSGCYYWNDPVEANKGPFCNKDCKPSSQPSLSPSKSVVPSSRPSLKPSALSASAEPSSEPSILRQPSSRPGGLTPSLILDVSSKASKAKAAKASKAAPYRRRRPRKRLRIRST